MGLPNIDKFNIQESILQGSVNGIRFKIGLCKAQGVIAPIDTGIPDYYSLYSIPKNFTDDDFFLTAGKKESSENKSKG
jgi:hypothetical protein